MYPYINIAGNNIYMTGIGVVIFIISVIFLINFYSKRFNINFWKFFNWLPIFLILPYILGGYFYNLFKYNLVIPLSLNDLFIILSPYGYEFNFIGITLGLIIALSMFLKKIDLRIEKLKWIDVFFYSISLSLVPFGIFLLLGDNFIGRPTSSVFGVSTFLQDSVLYNYDMVYPVGLFLSLLGISIFIIGLILNYIFRRYGIGIFGFIFLSIMINLVFYFQLYDKILVTEMFGYTFDIKNYRTIFISLYFVYLYFRLR
ncbi:hypothetical protein [Candidatus Vampirococcus lugosii]|uniref:Uncharacterized protein n=1 Tax=Candidatus Vampirococcus lugosii TaxID=2789015 RepID=A0ABS5QNJ4_9BACT|nr:hypothetical protein [Candidatus Vampirococcus lugosii]MBS8122258.1 hypothetical protein [Candidatus Vampirococcus lugosii]